MEQNTMTDKEQIAALIDIYTDLLRIQTADDRDREIRTQMMKAQAKLEALGVITEKLIIQ